ncbi:MAG TPA: single-stranded DNA-binding protein [Syntrophaceae bacterium]|nr:single-stranded DNA-binding protein [Syntrophaceae bacterium]
MANDLNQCQFIGRLGKDPEQRFLPNGDAVVNFSLAVGWKGKDKEGCEWVNVVAFKKLAEIIAQYCTKGQQVYISGKMRTRKWQDKEGQDRYSTEIVADQMQMVGGGDGNREESRPAKRPSQGRERQPGDDPDYNPAHFPPDDDFPF